MTNIAFKFSARAALIAFFLLVLSGCGSTEIMKNIDDTYTVAAQYGSANGSWDRASKEANERAMIYCEGKGLKLAVLHERRDGIWGISPQRAEVKFKCQPIIEPTKNLKRKESLEQRLGELKSLHQKGLLTTEQYDAQVNKFLSGGN